MSKKFLKNIVTGGWVTPPPEKAGGVNYITDKQYSYAAECEMDYLFAQYENPAAYGEKYIAKALEYAEKYGVQLFVGEYRLQDADEAQTKKILDFYGKYKSFAGVNLYDEPGIALFEKLEKTREKINAVVPNCTCFVNLLPMYAYSTILKGTYKEGDTAVATAEEYKKYVEEFISVYRSELLSYDFYPFRWEYGKYDKNFFLQMYRIYSASKKLEVPFWTFIQVTSWNPEIREMTDEEIEWQVHCSLALGAKGIMYFTYWLPFSSDAERYKQAIIERKGRKGKPFETVKKLNRFIHSLNETLGDADYRGVICGEALSKDIPDGYLTTLSDELKVKTNDNLLIGRFQRKNDEILYVVNTSFEESTVLDICFFGKYSVFVYTSDGEYCFDGSQRYSVAIKKCSAVVLKAVKQKYPETALS